MKLDRFIKRPVLSTVISILIVILGVLGLVSLPVTQYPDIAPPTVRVSTSYTGANAQTVLNSVIAPLEEQINGVENMMYMTSTATNTGDASIDVYFKQGTDPDMAAVNVQNRVAKAQGLLPCRSDAGRRDHQQAADQYAAGRHGLQSERPDTTRTFLKNYAQINLVPQIQRVPGVGDVMMMGADYSMRIWLKPDVMAQYKLMPTDVIGALAEQNIEAAPGQFGESGDQSFQYIMRYKGRLATPEEFEDIVIRATPGRQGTETRRNRPCRTGRTYVCITRPVRTPIRVPRSSSYQTAGSNATQIINDVEEILEQSAKDFPPGVDYEIMMECERFPVRLHQ